MRRPAARGRGRLAPGPGEGPAHGRRGRRRPGPARGVLPRPEHRLDRHLPAACGRLGSSPTRPGATSSCVIDGWGNFKAEYEMLEPARRRHRGARPRATASTWSSPPPAPWRCGRRSRTSCSNRLELRLGDTDGLRVRPQGRRERPGRASGPRPDARRSCTSCGAQPRIDGPAMRRRTCRTRRPRSVRRPSAATGRARPLPRCACCRAKLRADELPKGFEYPQRGIAFGIDENNLEPVFVDFDTDPFFLVFGESESGKTNLLRLSPSRSPSGTTATRPRSSSATTGAPCSASSPTAISCEYVPIARALELHAGRAGRPDGTPRTRARTSPRSSCATAAGGRGPRCLRHRRRLRPGLHVAAATRWRPSRRTSPSPVTSASASSSPAARRARPRSMYEPFMQRIKELGAQGVVLSGDPQRGRRARRRPAAARCPPGAAISSRASGGIRWCSSGGCRISSGIERARRTAIPLSRRRKPTGASRCHADRCAQCRGNSVMRVAFGAPCAGRQEFM